MEKDFIGWHALKEELHDLQPAPLFQQRDIWWCCVGVNIGYEVDGKHSAFNRPVLVVRKFNGRFFFGVPLTRQYQSNNPYHVPLHFQGKMSGALLSQARPFDAKRLTDRMGRLSHEQFQEVKHGLQQMLR